MRLSMLIRTCWLLVFLAGPVGGGCALADEPAASVDTTKESQEMPVLTGEQWQTLQRESKFAFIWGVGHVVTIEEHVVQRHPDLKGKGFVAKLAEGLKGIPMSAIVDEIDTFYQKNPDDLDLPVMRVIWSQLVKPKLASGIADRPFNHENDR